MTMKIVHMHFRGPARFGARGFQLEGAEIFVRSDTLFSALCHAWYHLYGNALTDRFSNGEAPFRLSSAFPFRDVDGEITYHLPKPMIRGNLAPDDPAERKKLKDITFIPVDTFRRWVNGECVEIAELTKYPAPLPEKHFVPRVSISRDTCDSEVYRAARVVFPEGTGLYTLVQIGDVDLEEELRAAFNLLGDMGLGGERSIGHGQFVADMVPAGEDWAFLDGDANARSWVALSLVNPRPDEIETVRAGRYALVDRGGWFHSPVTGEQLKRKTVCMVAEGSVFGEKIVGRVVDVTPKRLDGTGHHRIYRYGLCLAAPATADEGR